MRRVALVSACLAFAGYGRRVQRPASQSLARLLLTHTPGAAFHVNALGSPCGVSPRLAKARAAGATKMQEPYPLDETEVATFAMG
mmetsp:Transcript_68675/g.121922  ORF Transcript_68675/g.121922 Transcript_68675/m.121922 type:complete len:85 (+) Transcript_68675:65-319(+)